MTCLLITVGVFLLSGFASLGIAALIAASKPQPPPPPPRIDCRSRDRHPTGRTPRR